MQNAVPKTEYSTEAPSLKSQRDKSSPTAKLWSIAGTLPGPSCGLSLAEDVLMEAMFIQGMYSCNYRHDVMITGNPCPVEMQAEKGTHGAIC